MSPRYLPDRIYVYGSRETPAPDVIHKALTEWCKLSGKGRFHADDFPVQMVMPAQISADDGPALNATAQTIVQMNHSGAEIFDAMIEDPVCGSVVCLLVFESEDAAGWARAGFPVGPRAKEDVALDAAVRELAPAKADAVQKKEAPPVAAQVESAPPPAVPSSAQTSKSPGMRPDDSLLRRALEKVADAPVKNKSASEEFHPVQEEPAAEVKNVRKPGRIWVRVLLFLLLLAAGGLYWFHVHGVREPVDDALVAAEATGQDLQQGLAQVDRSMPEVFIRVLPSDASVTIRGELSRPLTVQPVDGMYTTRLSNGIYRVTFDAPGYTAVTLPLSVDGHAAGLTGVLRRVVGTIDITTVPGAVVLATNSAGEVISFGVADEQGHTSGVLPAQAYDVVLRHPFYVSRVIHNVEIQPDRTRRISGMLEPGVGELVVAAPFPAEVWLKGRKIGMTGEPLSELPAGRHVVEVRRAGFRPGRLEVEIPAGGALEVVAPAMGPSSGDVQVDVQVPEYAMAYWQKLNTYVRVNGADWREVQTWPHLIEGLSCKPHQIEVSAEGFVFSSDCTAGADAPADPIPAVVVDVEDGKVHTVCLVARPSPAVLRLDVNVANAQVVLFADGQEVLRQPAQDLLPVPALYEVDVRITAPYAEPQVLQIQGLLPQTPYRREVRLQRLSPVQPGREWILPEVGLTLDWIPPGAFLMGSRDGGADEEPVHRVRFTRGFWIGRYETTQAEYEAVAGYVPSRFRDPERPVDGVSWQDAMAFCEQLNARELQAGRLPEGYIYRLPTEAEWEYAARGANKSESYIYAGGNDPAAVGWYRNNASRKTQRVGRKDPNELGLYDFSGNVWEWCLDWYFVETYRRGAVEDPVVLTPARHRVLRGGSWENAAGVLRVANRFHMAPNVANDTTGFRLVLGPEFTEE